MFDRIRCQLGLHQWTPWESTHTSLIPIGGHDVFDVIDDDISVEVKKRSCNNCGSGEIKQVLHW